MKTKEKNLNHGDTEAQREEPKSQLMVSFVYLCLCD